MTEWLAMGGHGLYVWTAYSAALAVSVWVIASPLYRRRKFLHHHRRQKSPCLNKHASE